MFDGKLTIYKSAYLDDWWILTREEHSGETEWEPTKYGARLKMSSRLDPYTDVEGNSAEWLAIAEALENSKDTSFTRCGVAFKPEGVLVESPRNSQDAALITVEAGKYLAAQIKEKLGAKNEPE